MGVYCSVKSTRSYRLWAANKNLKYIAGCHHGPQPSLLTIYYLATRFSCFARHAHVHVHVHVHLHVRVHVMYVVPNFCCVC